MFFVFFFLKSALKFLDERYCQHSKHYLRKTPNCFTYVYRLTSWKHSCSEKIHPSCLTSSPHTNDLTRISVDTHALTKSWLYWLQGLPFPLKHLQTEEEGQILPGHHKSAALTESHQKPWLVCAWFHLHFDFWDFAEGRVVSAKYPWSTEGCQVELPRAACLMRTATAAEPVHP